MEKLYKRLILLRTEQTTPKYERYGFCGLFRRRVDLVDQYEKKLEDLEDNLRLEQSEVSLAGEVRAWVLTIFLAFYLNKSTRMSIRAFFFLVWCICT